MDVDDLEARSGWTLVHRPVLGSTNDEAAALVARGAGARVAVVADRQSAGRGREGRPFLSPPGGLYASLLLEVPSEDVPAGVVALVALAAAEAIDALTGARAAIKWPNDLWLGGRKVGGILLERRGTGGPVIAGIGLNLAAVPEGLPSDDVTPAGALAEVADPAPGRDDALLALLAAVDRLQALRQRPGGAEAIETGWRDRIALRGAAVTWTYAGARHEGVLEDVSLADGLRLREGDSAPVWRPAEHVQDLRPAARTI